MNNILSDQIEKLILEMLKKRNNEIVLKRRELANELECAPSQITYVINTRFSDNQNFIVESRRGSGGYIKISTVNNYPLILKKDVETKLDNKDVLNEFLYDLENSNIFDEIQFSLFMTAIQTFTKYCPDNLFDKGIDDLLGCMKNILRRYE